MKVTSLPLPDWFLGELVGTFLLIFFGLGAVGMEIAYGAGFGLLGVAAIWGLGLTVAIATCGPVSGAHLNPAITLAFARWRGFPQKRIVGYIFAQLLGAFAASVAVYFLCAGGIASVEAAAGWTRGQVGSLGTAIIFTTFYPHPGFATANPEAFTAVGLGIAAGAEFLGTALLALAVFSLTSPRQPEALRPFVPMLIGVSLTVLICVFAPVSMAGFNPARDLGPRLWITLAGWGSLGMTHDGGGWALVYLLMPCLGAQAGAGAAALLTRKST